MTTIFGHIFGGQNRPLRNVAERLSGSNELYRRMLDAHAEKHRSSIPAKVVSFNATKQTIVAQPLIREKVIDRETGSVQWFDLPQILDVPVQFPQAGNFVLTMPITAGDEVLLLFSDMCIDSWWTSGGIQNWNMRRRHDLSDAIAIPGINSVPNVIQNIANNAMELRTKDGTVKVSVFADKIVLQRGDNEKIEMSSSKLSMFFDVTNGIEITSAGVNIKGNLLHNGLNYTHHTHPVTTAPGDTGTVTELP
jgi:hypothetical protein